MHDIEGIEDISLTTNGVLLRKQVRELATAGLNRVNVSLDSLTPDKYREITRGGDINDVFEGIYEAQQAGLFPIKLNMVPIRGFNDDEIEAFAQLTMKTPLQVRFIEFMPIGASAIWSEEKYISSEEIKGRVSSIAPLQSGETQEIRPCQVLPV